jgi:hypothetical protein
MGWATFLANVSQTHQVSLFVVDQESQYLSNLPHLIFVKLRARKLIDSTSRTDLPCQCMSGLPSSKIFAI